MCLTVFDIVFSAVLMGIVLNSTNMHLFWLLLYSFFVKILIFSLLCICVGLVNTKALDIKGSSVMTSSGFLL